MTHGAPKRLRLSSRRQRAAPTSVRPGVECDSAEATRQRVVHTLCVGAGWERSSRAGTPLFSAASDRRRPAVTTPSLTAISSWPSYATVIAGDYANETVKGESWFKAWTTDSGNMPAPYNTAVVGLTNTRWFAKNSQLNP